MLKRKLSPQSSAVIQYMLNDVKSPVYGLQLIEDLKQPAGTIYPILERLESIGWIQGNWENDKQKDYGRRKRKLYTLTKEGKGEGRKHVKNVVKDLCKLFNLQPKAA